MFEHVPFSNSISLQISLSASDSHTYLKATQIPSCELPAKTAHFSPSSQRHVTQAKPVVDLRAHEHNT